MHRALLAAIIGLAGATAMAATPEVRRVLVGSSAGPDLTYASGDRISVTVQFDQEVEVTGIPVLLVGIGRSARHARMWIHSGSRLHFGYTVAPTDSDPDGISVGPDALQLGGGRITAGDADADISLAGHAITDSAWHKVDGKGTRRPKVTNVSITSDPGYDGIYAAGDEIEVTVEFDEGVTVEGSPSVAVTVGDEERRAVYRRGSGASRLAFVYEVAAGDVAEDGIALPKNGIQGPQLLADADGNRARTGYAAVPPQPEHRVDGVAPRVTGVEIVSTPRAGNVYGLNDAILVEVTFDDEVHWVEDWQYVWLHIGGKWRGAVVIEQGSPRSIVFRRLVGAGDSGGIRVAGDLVDAWPGIQDSAGNPASPAYDAAGRRAGDATVDGSLDDTTPPAVHSVRVVSIPRSGGIYREGERIAIRVAFAEELHVSAESGYAAAQLDLLIGDRVASLRGNLFKKRTYVDFEHIVGGSDVDLDGIVAGNLAMLDVADSVGHRLAHDQTVSLAGTPSLVDGRKRDAHRPRLVRAVPFPSFGDERLVRSDQFVGTRLHFDGMVEALGTPTIGVGDKARKGTGRVRLARLGVTRSMLEFFHEIVEDDYDADGFSIPASAWEAVSFRNQWGNPVHVDPADLAVENHGNGIAGKAPSTPASIVRVSLNSPQSNAFAAGDTIRVVVEFDDSVTAQTPPSIKLGPRTLPCELDDSGLRLTCERTVAAGESAENITLAANALQPPNAVTDANDNVVDLDLADHLDDIAPVSVDATPPSVTRVTLASRPVASNTYGAGAKVDVTVRFSEAVRVSGTPQVALSIGDAVRPARFERAAGAALRFRYVVVAEDADATGLSIAADAMRLNDGAITDLAGNPANLSHAALRDRPLHRVDGSVLDDSGTPIQIWIAEEPAAARGTPSSQATATLAWEMRSTWSAQPAEFYRVTSDHPGIRIGRASGRVERNQRIENSLTLPCPSHGTVNARLSIAIGEASAPVEWDVLCRYGRVNVDRAELFQGPLALRWEAGRKHEYVDIVTDRPTVLRLDVEHEGRSAPEVDVTVRDDEGEETVPSEYLASHSSDGRLISSYVAFPESVALGGSRFSPVIDPHDLLDANTAPPGEAFRTASTRTLPLFRPVLVPITVDDAPLFIGDSRVYLEHAVSLLPIGAVEYGTRDSVHYNLGQDESQEKKIDKFRVLEVLGALANEEGEPDEFYVGVLKSPAGWQPVGGIGQLPGNVTVSDISQGTWEGSTTVAHELGHNLGLRHAPGCNAGKPDPDFPFEDGGVGPEKGWSFHEARFVSPGDGYFDLLSYCRPRYIAEYHYDKAMAWGDHVRERIERNKGDNASVRLASTASSGEPLDLAPSPALSLALSGAVDEHGAWSLFASSTSTRPPRVDAPGEYTVSLFDDAGMELYQQSLTTSTVSHSNKRMWAVRVPIQPREVYAIRIRGTGGDLLLDAPVALPPRQSPSFER